MVNYTNAMTYGSHATISCNENYVLRGDSYLVCLNDGTWSGSAVCRGKQSHDVKHAVFTPDIRQSKTLSTIDERGSKIDRNSIFDRHLSPFGRQMAIENTVSVDF